MRPDRLGDVVLSTPLPREIKKKYPDAFIAVLVRKYTKAVFENNPHIDLILCDDFTEETRKETFWKRVEELRKLQFTDGLMLLPTERLNWMMFWAGISNRVGVGHKLYQTLSFAKSVSRNKYIPLRHESDYCMDLARKIGINTYNIASELHLNNEEKQKLLELKDEFKKDKKYVVGIHTTFGGSSPNVSALTYRKVIEELKDDPDIKVIVTGNEVIKEIADIEGVTHLTDNLRDLFILIGTFDLLVSSSTGPAHVAAALRIPTLTLFCPLPACHPTLWSPIGNDANYLMPDEKYCGTVCPGDPHLCRFEGEGGINESKIIDAIRGIISTKELQTVL